MNQQNAFDRIAELEAKLAIATQNCEQAVKERDELLVKWHSTRADFIDAKYGNADENENELEKLRERLVAMGKERDELREAILMLGFLTGTEGYCGDHVMLTVRLNFREADAWNEIVAKLRTNGKEGNL